MSVFVDPIFAWPKSPKWPWGKASHMYANTAEELHAFAAKLKLKREWCSDHTHKGSIGLLHYDLTPGKRAEAVRLGALEKSQLHMVYYDQRQVNEALTDRCRELQEEVLDLKAQVERLKRKKSPKKG